MNPFRSDFEQSEKMSGIENSLDSNGLFEIQNLRETITCRDIFFNRLFAL